MKLTIEEKKEKICVTVTFKARTRDEKVQYMDTAAVKAHLKGQNYDLEHYTIQQEPSKVVHNSFGAHRLTGEWVFIDQRALEIASDVADSTINTKKVLENKNNIYENKKNIGKKVARKKRQAKLHNS